MEPQSAHMPAPRAAGDLGSLLRDARQRRGLTLRQIATATKIPAVTLEALERNDMAGLPGGIFSRAFVRSYALEVDVDPDQAVQLFSAQYPRDAPASPRTELADRERIEGDRRIASTALWLILCSIPIGGALLYFSTTGRQTRERGDPSAADTLSSASASPHVVVAPAADRAAVALASAAAVDAPAVAHTNVPIAAVDRLVVQLTVTRSCWVSAIVDGDRAVAERLQPADRRTLDVRQELALTVGDAGAVALTLNGAPARPLGIEGQVVSLRLGPATFTRYLASR
jgi:cytoskeleton protein RodZ